MLCAIYAYLSHNVLSATMSHWLLLKNRFIFSPDFTTIPTRHMTAWYDDPSYSSCSFQLRPTKDKEGNLIKVEDYFINNVIYRPPELELICCYELEMLYELVKLSSNRSDEYKSKIMLFCEEHPSSKFMGM